MSNSRLIRSMKSGLEIIKVFPFFLDVIYNIKEWLSPHAEEVHAHTQPKSFVRYEQGHCIMRTTRSGQKLNIPLLKTASGQKNFLLQNYWTLE